MDHHGLISAHARACFFAVGLFLFGCQNTVARPSGTGSGTVLTWTNGTTPVSQNSGVSVELNNVTFGGDVGGNGLFVAVGEAGTILASPDGVTWTRQNSNTLFNLYGVSYANNQFIAVGDSVVLSGSSDGVTWSVEDVSGTLSLPLNGVCYADGQFVAVGNNQIMTSADGSNWNSLPPEPSGITGPTVDLFNTAFGNNQFVTVGTYNESTSTQEIVYDGLIATSPDGLNWSTLPYTSNYLSGITYGGLNSATDGGTDDGGQFVAVGREGSILTSADGTNWTAQSAPQLNMSLTPYLIGVVYGGGQYVVTGNYVGISPSTGFLLTSQDGNAWTMQSTGSNLYGVAYGVVAGVGTFVAVGGQ